MTRPLRVFISGPLSAPDLSRRLQNVDAANEAAVKVIEAGHYPFVPHNMIAVDELCDVKMPEDWWLKWCCAWLDQSDVLYRIGASFGADLERTYALEKGIPVVESVSALVSLEG